MKKYVNIPLLTAFLFTLVLASCSNVTLTSWKSPKASQFRVTSMVVWALFDKKENEGPFEQTVVDYFNKKGIKAISAMTLLNPMKKYAKDELVSIFRNSGANCVLILKYQNTDKSETYVPGTTTVFPDAYYNYYNFYSYAYPGYWGAGTVVETPGYWSTSVTINLIGNLYTNTDEGMIYSSQIQITDPVSVPSSAQEVAQKLYADWKQYRRASGK
jgi:hypothetical protein